MKHSQSGLHAACTRKSGERSSIASGALPSAARRLGFLPETHHETSRHMTDSSVVRQASMIGTQNNPSRVVISGKPPGATVANDMQYPLPRAGTTLQKNALRRCGVDMGVATTLELDAVQCLHAKRGGSASALRLQRGFGVDRDSAAQSVRPNHRLATVPLILKPRHPHEYHFLYALLASSARCS